MSAVIAETRSWQEGPYTVWQRPRFDSPAWPVYLVFRGEQLVGKSFSVPDLSCCQWLEHQGGTYAQKSKPRRGYSYGRLHRVKAPAS